MGTWIKEDGKTENVSPESGGQFSLEELQGFVGGPIELVELADGRRMYVNEEGKLGKWTPNEKATFLCNCQIIIAGNVIICEGEEG